VIWRLVRKARAVSDVIVAASAILRARRVVARRPIGELVGGDGGSEVPQSGGDRMDQAQWNIAARWGAAVDRALRWLPGDSACLVRASALRQLVVTRGLPLATVRIGVRRHASGFEAHAWVEHDGTPIAEPDRLRGAFNSLNGVTLR
jgi:Transglutaminase-like superfamily